MSSSSQHIYSSNEDDFHNVTPELLRTVTPSNGPIPNRAFYPLRQHQLEFDENEGRGFISPEYGLNMLVDPGNRPPPHKLLTIIKCTILGSPRQRLTLNEIRIAMCRRFTYFSRSENTGWCNTVRHILSVEQDFERVPRPKTIEDSGSWWKVTRNADPPDCTPMPARSRRPAQASSSSSRSRAQGFPSLPRQRRAEPWMEMTSTFTTSEAQDRDEFYSQYYAQAQRGHGSVNQYATGPYASASSSAPVSYARSSETSSPVDIPTQALPGLHSLGLLDLGTRSRGQANYPYPQSCANSPYSQSPRGTRDDNEYDYEADEDEDEIENE